MLASFRDQIAETLLVGRASGLLRLFGVLSLVAVVAILLLATAGLKGAVRSEIMRQAEEDAVRVGRAIFEQERPLLVVEEPGGRARMEVHPGAMERLNERMMSYLPPLNMFKIKAFSSDKRLIYSTDPSLIGRNETTNPRLNAVLNEQAVISEAKSTETIWHLAGEEVKDAMIVETYLPVFDQARVVGAFEVYVDVTSATARIDRLVLAASGELLLSLAIVFGALYLLMREAAGRLRTAEQEMERLASTDPLTGIANRRYLLERAQAEYASLVRNREIAPANNEIGFIMADIDHFKGINDSYGHLVGDEVLRHIAERIKQCLREYDLVGRFGGEEFLIMLPHTDLEGALAVAERTHRAIRGRLIETAAGRVRVTASLGVSSADDASGGVAAAIKRADDALYEAKRSGRDRVIAVEPQSLAQATGNASVGDRPSDLDLSGAVEPARG